MVDAMTLIKEGQEYFSKRNQRMDNDTSLYLLDKYVFRDENGKKLDDMINVTLNEPRVFAEKVMTIIGSAYMQCVVEGRGEKGKLSDKDTTRIEEFLKDLFISVDTRLLRRGFRNLHAFLIEQICLRGTIASRNLLWQNQDGTYSPDILPCDSRYLVYEYGVDGIIWAASQTYRSQAQLESEYPDCKYIPSGKNIEVWDFWNEEVNEVYAGGKKIFDQENTLGHTSYVIVESSAGPMLLDKDFITHRGESVFATVRDLYPEYNRLASILQTLNVWSFYGPTQYESEMGEMAQKPEKAPYGTRKVIPVEPGRGYKPFPINDVRNAARQFQALISSAIQRATFSNLEYGTLSFPLSAVAISKILQQRDAIVLSRLNDLAIYYQQTAQMLKRQYVEGGIPAIVGEEGLEKEYDTDLLSKKVSIKYKFYTMSPEQDIANHSMANQIRPDLVSADTIRRDILKLQDPDAEKAKIRAEQSEKVDMAIMLYNQVHSLVDEAEKISSSKEKDRYYVKAELVLRQLEALLRQRAQGQMAGYNFGSDREEARPKPLVPMTSGGGGGTQSSANEYDISPEEMESRAESRAVTVRRQTDEGE